MAEDISQTEATHPWLVYLVEGADFSGATSHNLLYSDEESARLAYNALCDAHEKTENMRNDVRRIVYIGDAFGEVQIASKNIRSVRISNAQAFNDAGASLDKRRQEQVPNGRLRIDTVTGDS